MSPDDLNRLTPFKCTYIRSEAIHGRQFHSAQQGQNRGLHPRSFAWPGQWRCHPGGHSVLVGTVLRVAPFQGSRGGASLRVNGPQGCASSIPSAQLFHKLTLSQNLILTCKALCAACLCMESAT